MTHEQIIAALERATEPDRELANEILFACGWECDESGDGPDRTTIWVPPGGRENSIGFIDGDHPDPTASIDDALSTVPEGLNYVLRSLANAEAEARVGGFKNDYIIKGGHHRVPAIALSIAALKARAAVHADT